MERGIRTFSGRAQLRGIFETQVRRQHGMEKALVVNFSE